VPAATDPDVAVNAAIVGERPTGLGVYALRLIAALDALGEHLTVYTSRPDLIVAPSARVRRAPAGTRPERGALGHVRRLLWTQTGLRLSLRRHRPRVLLNTMPEGVLASPVPQVTVVHDVVPLLYPREYPRQQYYFRYYVPRVLRSSAAVVAISESTRRDVLRFYGLPEGQVHVALSGYDASRFPPADDAGPGPDEPYALFVGNVLPHKNLLRLVEAFALVRRRVSARLMIRGGGRPAYVSTLRDKIGALAIADWVDWQPYTDPGELPALYRGARMLVLPSFCEGFGLPALEAMACGTPVVTSNVSALPEVVGDAALLVDPADVVAIADAMERVFTDDALAKDLRRRGLARARVFSWDRTARAVQALLRAAA